MLKAKIANFLWRVEGRSYTSKSLSKVLNINPETSRKYLRQLYYEGAANRVKVKKQFRYYA